MNENKQQRTITTPPVVILKYMILTRRNNIINEIERYHFHNKRGGKPQTYALISLIKSLFDELRCSLKDGLSKQDYEKLRTSVTSGKSVRDYLDAFETIDDFLYAKKLTKFDMKEDYDTTDWELENALKGFT